MSTAEKIFRKAQTLPEKAQDTLLQIAEQMADNLGPEDEEWSRFSLSAAIKGLTAEDWPDYTAATGFEKW
jgi:hypothetical protein